MIENEDSIKGDQIDFFNQDQLSTKLIYNPFQCHGNKKIKYINFMIKNCKILIVLCP